MTLLFNTSKSMIECGEFGPSGSFTECLPEDSKTPQCQDDWIGDGVSMTARSRALQVVFSLLLKVWYNVSFGVCASFQGPVRGYLHTKLRTMQECAMNHATRRSTIRMAATASIVRE
jgi:hypothetical protein